MSPELELLLCERYPQIFRYRRLPPTEHSMGRGFDCGDGWFVVIDAACAVIASPYLGAKRHYEWMQEQARDGIPEADAAAIRVARLQMSAKEQQLPSALQVKEKLGTLRFYLEGGGERTRACAEFAQYMSEFMCEICGRPGIMLSDGGWMRMRCEFHDGE